MCFEARVMMAVSAVILVTLAALLDNTNAAPEANIPATGRMNFTELCQEFNQTCEEYEVLTQDGYILLVHRIKGDEKRPVLLWHGILDSSDTYILRGLNSTGISLAAAGYDVWLGNSRGNKYSRRHQTLNPDEDQEFWDYSFHEMGYYDMPATIDFILEKTGQNKLSAIGHSQGTTTFYVLGSTRPDYNEKIQIFISLAPIAYLTNIKPMARDLIPLWPALNAVMELAGDYEVMGAQSNATELLQLICSQDPLGFMFCEQVMAMAIAGNDSGEIDMQFFNMVLGHYPAGTSTKDVTHYTQFFERERVAHFDYGLLGNLRNYRSLRPPDYRLSDLSAPVALLCGASDRVSTLEDVALLRAALPNVARYHVMERPQFNHLDFVWGEHMNVYLNPLIIELLSEYTS